MRFLLPRLLVVAFASSLATVTVHAQKSLTLPKPTVVGLAPIPGDPAPNLHGKDLSGTPVEYAWDDVKLSIVHFWVVECEPCRIDMPVLDELQRQNAARGLRVVGVLMDLTKAERARKFLDEVAAHYPMLRGDRVTYSEWGGVSVAPMAYLVGPDGKIVRKYIGADAKTVAALRFDVDAYLSGKPVGPPVLPGDSEKVNPEP